MNDKDYDSILTKQRKFFETNTTREVSFRINALKKLRQAIVNHEKEIYHAMKLDFNKSEFESFSTEVGIALSEISFALKYLKLWAKPEKVKTPLTHFGSKSYIYKSPYGVVLIISPWNYPFLLSITPLIGAIAAGNCSVLKPSELTVNTSNVIEKIIKEAFEEQFVAIVQGDAAVATHLLDKEFDYIFFTGGSNVGRIVAQKAAQHLTPVTLELGGKSPCIVCEDANLKLSAKRIAWAKFLNAGQTCIAPDYLYIHKSIKEEFLNHLTTFIKQFYTDNPLQNDNYAHIISQRHFKRLVGFLKEGKVIYGGKIDDAQLIIEPTVLDGISWDCSVMKEEIFGPILPVLEFSSLEEVIRDIEKYSPNPLALYIYTNNKFNTQKVIKNLQFGGGCVNDSVMHFANPYIPFGGIGNSGIGKYHGKYSFETFSYQKSILKQTINFDIPFRYPNVKIALKILKIFLR